MMNNTTGMNAAAEPLSAARWIKEIGRGKDGARNMTRADATTLYAAMLAGRVSQLELGAILLSMRIKGESVDEVAGFLDAAADFLLDLTAPEASEFAPVVIPSYNGARKKANLTPLLALLLAQAGVPVLVHGVADDPGRVTSAEIFAALGITAAQSAEHVSLQMAAQQPVFMTIQTLSPALANQLSMRRILGVRNSAHTLVKLLQPFTTPVLRLNSYTHPEYLNMLSEYLLHAAPADAGEVFLMRGTEGEAVASTGRAQRIDWIHQGQREVLLETEELLSGPAAALPAAIDAASTAAWISEVLRGQQPVPTNIARQVALCIDVARRIKQGQGG